MGIDTKIILIPCIITEILMKTRFSVMVALICILRGLPKDARVASFRFLKSTLQRYRKSKKNFVWTVLQGSPKIWGLATGLSVVTLTTKTYRLLNTMHLISVAHVSNRCQNCREVVNRQLCECTTLWHRRRPH